MTMARLNSEADSDFNWLQFIANHEMHSLLPDNTFANASTEDNSFTALLGLPVPSATLPHTTQFSEIFAPDGFNVSLAGDLQHCFTAAQNVPHQQKIFGTTSESNGNLAGIEPATCVFPAFPADPAFVERAAKFSCFAKENCQKAEESAPGTVETVTSGNSNETAFESPMSGKDAKCNRPKKRKAVQKAMNSVAPKVKRSKAAESAKDAIEDSNCKAERSNNDNCAEKTDEKKNVKASPAPIGKTDYIHVRARRGQATDSHSLAERVRREKISERMKLLQDLVPGCSKITGKALMLDEIINHVQSLQRQVEFLSMKLATVSHRFDIDIDRVFAKDILTSCQQNPPNGGISTELTASPYLQYQHPEPAVLQSLSPWNAQLDNIFNLEFHPARMQSPFNSLAISGNFTVNHVMKREM